MDGKPEDVLKDVLRGRIGHRWAVRLVPGSGIRSAVKADHSLEERTMRAWYVARTKPRRELQTSVVLDNRGLDTYFPLVTSRRLRRVSRKPEPLFPGYLFVSLDATSSEWIEARSAPGIVYFLGAGDAPTAVPETLIAEIRRRVAQQEVLAHEPAFHPGDRVVITEGPFQGLEAVFDGTLSPSGRSRVLVSIVSRLVPVHLDVDQIRPYA